MKSSTKRAFSLLGTAGLFIATLAAYSFLLRPTYAEVSALSGEYSTRKNAFDEQRVVIDGVEKAIAEYQGQARLQDTIARSLPFDEAAAPLIAELQAVATVSGLVVQSMNIQSGNALKAVAPASEKGVHAVGTAQVALAGIGSYDALKRFIDGVETNIRLMDVAEWRAEPAAKGKGDILAINMTINAYYQGE